MSETGQQRYQVRFDHGPGALGRIGDGVDVVVWVDAIAGASVTPPLDLAPDAAVVAAGLADASAVATWILAEQERLGRRAYLAVVAAGGRDGAFAADDVLAAGALIDALADHGIDDTSPEAAVACAAFTGLRRAVRHLASASGEGRAALAAGARAQDLHHSVAPGSTGDVRVLRAPGAP